MLNRKFNLLLATILLSSSSVVLADTCPTPETVKDRKISRVYAWYIDERRTLDDVLAVEKLYSVRLKNSGEYVSCYYSGSGRLLEMDAWPLKTGCSIVEYQGEWQTINEEERVCTADDMSKCQFAIYCDERTQ
ncbi:MAG: hypothetical protein RIB78_07285 [Gammaproteobacteria bacterium]